jgi:SAM-dependent methyltransferase
MLRRRTPPTHAVLADAARLPFAGDTFDLVMGGFCLGHLPDPGAALAEWRRVGPATVATAFASGPAHPAKVAVDEAAERFGFLSPPWYEQLKAEREPQVEDPELLASLARSAGFREATVTQLAVDTGVHTPAEIVSWRWGMAHLAPFVEGLTEERRAVARRESEDAVAGIGPVIVDIQVLSALA